jgi:serine phosphatase RsbU (regulator of sigma subunit)/PAS domain-containing protein
LENLALEPGVVLDSLFDHADFGLALLDADLRFVKINAELAAINDLPPEEHLGRSIGDVPGMPRQVVDACRTVIAENTSITGVSVEGPLRDGHARRTFECAYHPVCANGESTGVWLTVTEVTGERRARDEAEVASADLARERVILREVIGRAPAPMAVMWGEELVFTYVNAQAQAMLEEGKMIGRRAADVFPAGAELATELRDTVLLKGETAQVKKVPVGDRFWTFACVAIPSPEGQPGGVLAVGQDVTEEVTQSRQLEEELADEQRIATQLQVSLMPDQLPAVPGMDLASGFRPAGDGHEIGGDFYDVFEMAEGCWMVVIGDVCGKGAEAAALTALARYTLRAAAIREGAEPATLLRQLNEAIMRQREDMRFLSAVCLFLDLDLDQDGATRARVCVAGHLPPLVVRAGGAVEAIEGGGGPVLGVWEEPQLSEQMVRLDAGARMILYTDGVLDARSSSELTEEGLATIVSGLADADAAATVAAIERSVIGPGEAGRDDMAVLVIRQVA